MTVEIKIDDIQELTSRLLSRIRDEGNLSVAIDRDDYWDMRCKHRYNTHGISSDQAAKHLIKPSLSDALTKVNEVLQGTLPDSVGALIYIAPLLRAIGEEFLKAADSTYCR